MKSRICVLAVCAALALAPRISIAAARPAQGVAGDIMIEQPWSPATPRGAATAAAYLTIVNRGPSADRLLGGSSPAGRIEIHQMSMANGVMSMRAVRDGLAIPRGATIALAPQGNYHLMVTGLKAPFVAGTHVPAVLNFAKAGPVQIELSIAPIGARAPAAMTGSMAHMDHH